nr:transketolase C-terminal domain-containing protein [uncultured Desulfobacter sp.]
MENIETNTIFYRDALTQTMYEIMSSNPNAIVMGEGVKDPTGIFGTTLGLADEFGPERVVDTPIAEESFTGFSLGCALNGLYPIVTHIRVDFLVVAMNQLVNSISKYSYMYGGALKVPMLIRSVIGRSWGQGPQHSQSLQALFAHIPGLTVIMPATAEDVLEMYPYIANEYKAPVISIEHRFLYDYEFNLHTTPRSKDVFAPIIIKEGRDVTIVTTSYMLQEAILADKWIKKNHGGISCEIINLRTVSDIDAEPIMKSIAKTGHLIIADTGWESYGVAAEICRLIATRAPHILKQPVIPLNMQPVPTPTSHDLEQHFYPDLGDIVNAVYQLLIKVPHPPCPAPEYIKSTRRKFRGPF